MSTGASDPIFNRMMTGSVMTPPLMPGQPGYGQQAMSSPIAQLAMMFASTGGGTPSSGLLGKIGDVKPKPEYQIAHAPMADAGGAARLHDLTASFPPDVYGPNALQYYGSGDPRESAVMRILQAVRGKPDAEVTVYRGAPADAKGINPGDWVTLHPSVAQDYASQYGAGGKVLSMKAKAADVTSWPDSLLEFGYFPGSSKGLLDK